MPSEKDEGPPDFQRGVPTVRAASVLLNAGQGVPASVDGNDELTIPMTVATESGLIARQRKAVMLHLDDSMDENYELDSANLHIAYESMLGSLIKSDILGLGGVAKGGDVPPPSVEQIQIAFSAEGLQLASAFKKPVLLLTPDSSVKSTIIIMGRIIGKFGIKSIETNRDLSDRLPAGMDKITSWSVSIVEGAPEIEGNASEQSPIGSMTLQQYLMLVIATANNGGIDRKSVTLIKDPLLKEDEIIQAFITPDGILHLDLVKAGEEAPFPSHFRPSVDGNIPTATKE